MEPTRALNPDFFPTYLLDENANAEKEEVVADNSKISEDFNLKLAQITKAISAELSPVVL